MKKRRAALRGNSPRRVLEIVNNLERYALTVSPEAIRRYSCHGGTQSGGCNKFRTCDIHPNALKERALSEVEPSSLLTLKKLGCLRPLIAEHKELFRDALAAGELTLSDFFGAVQTSSPKKSSEAARLLAANRCSYYGCVVPELAELVAANDVDQKDPYQATCPFSRRIDHKTQRPERNYYRLLACELTRESVREFQRAAGVISVSPVAIVPGKHDNLGDVVYIGRDPFASYQYLALDPANFQFEIPQAQARLHAPRLVRHSYGKQVKKFGDRLRTFQSLAAFSDEPDLSPLESSLGIRYVPSGEFMFLCLMWLWTGENRTTGKLSWKAPREVTIESEEDLSLPGEKLLLSQLVDLGFTSDLTFIFGDLELRDNRLLRQSSRLSDLVLLGLLSRSAPKADLALTPRSMVLSNWLGEVVALLRSDLPETSRFSALNRRRAENLLPSSFAKSHDGALEEGVHQMIQAISSGCVEAWLNGLRLIIKVFDTSVSREEYRKYLREEGFPIYPLVHLTLLLGIAEPLDWLALPLGGTVSPGAGFPTAVPQAGAFILALAREPERIHDLVNSIRPILSVPALVESSSLVEEVISAKASVMDFGAIVLARQHEIKSLPSELAVYADPLHREENLAAATSDPKKRQDLSDQLGRMLTAAQLLRRDMEFIDGMRGNHWRFNPEKLEDIQAEVIRRAWQVLEPLEEARGRKLKFLPGPSRSIWAPRAAAFHLAIEALRNILRHDKGGDGVILVTLTAVDQERLDVDFWNSIALIKSADVSRFNALKLRAASSRADTIDGDSALLLLCQMADCEPWKANSSHPLNGNRVGVLKLRFFIDPRS